MKNRRKLMKKFIAAGATLLGIIALAGCASTESAAPAAAAPAEAAAAAPAAVVVPKGEVVLLDGFEEGQFWNVDTNVPDGLLGEITSEKGVVDGSNAFHFMFKPTKWAVISTTQLAEVDWTGANYFVFDVLNDSDAPVSMGMCLMDGDSWTWQQTPSVVIQPGKTTFVAGLTDGTFVNTKVGGPVKEIAGVANISFCAIVVHDASKDTSVYIDNVRLIK